MIIGAIDALSIDERARLFNRGGAARTGTTAEVAEIINAVRTRGDEALRDMALQFDNVALDTIEVPRTRWDAALEATTTEVRAALEQAAKAIRTFHTAQLPSDIELEVSPGVVLGRRAEPLDSVGVYAPGGRAAYPSSVLMGVIPARVAGVREVVVCSPAGPDGMPTPVVLAACAIAGADRVFAIGGAGAIAALAFGTQTVTAVAKIVGPGNAYVTEAKQQVNGLVAIDSPAGPSEVLVLADADADADLVAIELLAQAEHDPDAAAVAVFIDAPRVRAAVSAAIARLTPVQPRAGIIEAALRARGALLDARTLDDAIAFAALYAPEHLSLMVRDPCALLPRVRNAGTVFLGASSSVAFGDYMTGANHVLPTNRLARSYSGLSTLDFVRFVTWQQVSAEGAARLAEPTRTLALAEGLPAHALAASVRAQMPTSARTTDVACDVCTRTVRTRTRYNAIDLYEPGRTPCAVDLSDNTNLHGVPPAARATLTAAANPLVTRYPTVYGRDLKRAIAERFDLEPDNVATGCGSDDILDAIIRAFCNTDDVVAFPTPTFGVVDLFARMNVARPQPVPHNNGMTLDVAALARTRAAVTYICNPNNPTGTLYGMDAVRALERSITGVLVIDEAYADYAGIDAVSLAKTSDRTIVVRTMSKAYGLAGLRVGYAIGDARLIREIEKARGPYKVGGLAEAAAVAAIRHDGDWVRTHVAQVVTNRNRLAGLLRAEGLAPLESAANFLLVPVPEGPASSSAAAWAAALRREGVAVRALPDLPGIGGAIRVTVGPWPLMERFMNAVRATRAVAGRVSGGVETGWRS